MHINRLVVLLLLAVLITACGGNAPRLTSTDLVIYSFSAYIPSELLSRFETETGVSVTLEEYATNEEMLAGLNANPGKYDVIVPSDYAVEILINQKGLLPLDLGAIPNYNKLDPAFLSPYFDPGGANTGRRAYATDNEKYSLPYQWGTTGIAYDATKAGTPITKWSDLWRPEFAGHLILLDDARELLGAALLSIGYDKNSTDPARLAEARDKLKELAPGVIAYDSEKPENLLISGEAWVGVVYNGNASLAARENPNIVYVFPEEGAGIWFDNLAIPVKAPHPDAAQAFINFVLAPENSALITRDFPYSNPNLAALDYLQARDLALYEQYQSDPASNPPQDAVINAQLTKNVGDTSALYEEFWNEVKATK